MDVVPHHDHPDLQYLVEQAYHKFDTKVCKVSKETIKESMARVASATRMPGLSSASFLWEAVGYPDRSSLKIGWSANPLHTGTFALCEGLPYMADPRKGAAADPPIAELVLRHSAGLLTDEHFQAALTRREALAAKLAAWFDKAQHEDAARKLLGAAEVTYFRYVSGGSSEAKPGMPGFEILWPGVHKFRVLLLRYDQENRFWPGVIPGIYQHLDASAVVETATDLGEKDFPSILCQPQDAALIGVIKAVIGWHDLQRIILLAVR